MMSSVLTEINAGVAVLTLNRPEVRNAFSQELVDGLCQAVKVAGNDESVRCLVLRGQGDHFSVGGDIEYFRDRLQDLPEGESVISPEIVSTTQGIIRDLQLLPKPVIASVKGSVGGFGSGLVQACDLVVAATDVVYSLAFCHIGLSPDGGVSYFLPRTVGLKRSMEMALLGERYDAEQLLSMGLVNRVVAVTDLEAETMNLAGRLVAGPAKSQAYTKALINNSLQATQDEQLDAEARHIVECSDSADFAEGVKAFCERRKPSFG